jgi:ABC-2 type transport system ATP-binding protein
VHRTFASADPEVGEVRAVDGIDLDIRPGEIVALLGPNGAGKTTTLDMVLGFAQPTSGSVAVLGMAPQEAVLSGRVAAVLQTGGLLRDLTVRETVELVASTHPNPQSPDSVIERAGLEAIQQQRVQSCSGGEQQRLRFALALLGDPDLLVLDEPTTGMDVAARQEFWASMRAEAERGRTIVFATHYLQEAEDFAQRTVLMANGRIVADGATDEVRRHAAGRRLSARVAEDRIESVRKTLLAAPHVRAASIERGRLVVDTNDSDEVARQLLGPLAGTDLEIEAASLETAFIELTRTGGAA